MVGYIFGNRGKFDTTACIDARPESNRELLWGYFLGFFGSFVIGALVSIVLGIGIHLFSSLAPFSLATYFFYLLTLFVPSMIFYTGLSFLVFVLVRRQVLGLFILFVCLFFNVRYADGCAGGLFDPLGIYLPNAISGITGHPNLYSYLIQRICWCCVGFGLAGIGIKCFSRLPNSPGIFHGAWRVAGLFIAGLGCAVVFYGKHESVIEKRACYRETYKRYAGKDYLTLEHHDIEVCLEGDAISCKSSLNVENRTGREQNEMLLFLNPGLEVSSIRVDGKEAAFCRDGQVVRVERGILPSEKLTVDLTYAGRIDERVCCLDVLDPLYFGNERNRYLSCRFGKRHVFLGKNYTLLLPGCLWYPVTVPPENPRYPLDVSRQFVTYRLTVSGQGEQQVISQGTRKQCGDRVMFETGVPLTGITLCSGDYVTRAITVDSVQYEISLLKNSRDLFRGVKRADKFLPELIRETRALVERQMGKDYPYSRFALVETPLAFASYYRDHMGGDERVQPGMVLVPERGIGYWKDIACEKKHYVGCKGMEDLDPEFVLIRNFMHSFLLNQNFEAGGLQNYREFELFQPEYETFFTQTLNVYYLSSMFHAQTYRINCTEYPLLDKMFYHLVKIDGKGVKSFSQKHSREENAVEYLKNHSLSDVFHDSTLLVEVREEIFSLKAKELFQYLNFLGVPSKEFYVFIESCVRETLFKEIDFREINERFRVKYGVDWGAVLSRWYHQDVIPTYLLREFRVEALVDPSVEIGFSEHTYTWEEIVQLSRSQNSRVQLEIYNDSEVDGLVTLEKADGFDLFFEIEAGKGKVITFPYHGSRPNKLNFGIAGNWPLSIYSEGGKNIRREKVTPSVRYEGREYFLRREDPDVILVDNEDTGFELPPKTKLWLIDDLNDKACYSSELITRNLNKWVLCREARAHGTPIHSMVLKRERLGQSFVAWNAKIVKEGQYDIFVYVDCPWGFLPGGNKNLIQKIKEGEQERLQFYTIRNGGQVYEVEVDVRKTRGWIPVGEFYLTVGDIRMELSDRGVAGFQIIVGDAVKFVRVGK